MTLILLNCYNTNLVNLIFIIFTYFSIKCVWPIRALLSTRSTLKMPYILISPWPLPPRNPSMPNANAPNPPTKKRVMVAIPQLTPIWGSTSFLKTKTLPCWSPWWGSQSRTLCQIGKVRTIKSWSHHCIKNSYLNSRTRKKIITRR